MKEFLLAAIFLCSTASAVADPILPELVGIWASEGSEFKGEALMKGQALYIDTDGIGGFVGGDGRAIIGMRMVVTSYSPSTKVVDIDLTEHGKVVTSGTLIHDSVQGVLLSQDQKQRYERRATTVSSQIRKSLGLEPRKQ